MTLGGRGAITNDVFKFRKIIQFQSSPTIQLSYKEKRYLNQVFQNVGFAENLLMTRMAGGGESSYLRYFDALRTKIDMWLTPYFFS